MNNPYILIDGLNVFMRHFAANPSRSLNGNLCGGILGTLKNIQTLYEKFNPKKVIICWEGGGSLRRRNLDKNYKEGRRPVKINRSEFNSGIPETIENRDNQLKTLIYILNMTPITQVYVNDCEADDIISYLKLKYRNQNKIIVTSDKDFYQLVDEKTHIWSPNQKKILDKDSILQKFNILPTNFCTARCFAGDQSDGIKGAKGAGFKVLSKRFPELSTDDNVTVNDIITMSESKIKSGSKLKIFGEIVKVEKAAKLNWRLMYLDTAMLSYNQVKSINNQDEKIKNSFNKMDLMRFMINEGLNQFDIHSFFITLKANLIGDVNV